MHLTMSTCWVLISWLHGENCLLGNGPQRHHLLYSERVTPSRVSLVLCPKSPHNPTWDKRFRKWMDWWNFVSVTSTNLIYYISQSVPQPTSMASLDSISHDLSILPNSHLCLDYLHLFSIFMLSLFKTTFYLVVFWEVYVQFCLSMMILSLHSVTWFWLFA